ncbi:MAG: leucyl/phenylalanyl-tRNA--protein transferase [Pseudomonadota bacterium]
MDLTVLGDNPEDFPPLAAALREPDGLLAVGGDLSVPRLLAAYRRGIFPWFGPGDPVLWWSPDPRFVLVPARVHVGRSLQRTLARRHFRFTFDADFPAVIEACSRAPRPGQPGTWITRGMREAYARLHREGHAHSVEAWLGDELAGGLYGVAIGRMFFGESMFARADDASKAAFVVLCRHLAHWQFPLVDCQMETPHLARFGGHFIERTVFAATVQQQVRLPAPDWRLDPSLAGA